MYSEIVKNLLVFTGELIKPTDIPRVAKDYYRGVLRFLLVLHHDFPEFLAENNYRFCCSIPMHCTQLRNLVISAYPSYFPELPDPFTAGLKVDRLEEIRKSPKIRGDIEAPLVTGGIKNVLDNLLLGSEINDADLATICDAAYQPRRLETGFGFAPVTVDTVLLHALALYIGISAIKMASPKGQTFNSSSSHARLLERLARKLRPEARYHFISAIVNQLRYPNSHTHYFSYALLHLFGAQGVQGTAQESEIAQQITRVLLERLLVHRPHPWGLIITLLETLKNSSYQFWNLPFVKATPEVRLSCSFGSWAPYVVPLLLRIWLLYVNSGLG